MNINHKVVKAATIGILATVAVILTFFSEKSPLLKGYGSDGLYYGHYALTLDTAIKNKQFPYRGFERILGIAIPHIILKVLPISTTPDSVLRIDNQEYLIAKNAIYVYMAYNLVLYFISLFLWHRIVSKIGISLWAYVLSFILLFVNFCNLKQYFYEPVMLDPTTLCYALLLLYVWLNSSVRNLSLVSVLGLFVNTASIYICLLLLFFKRKEVMDQLGNTKTARAMAALAATLIIAISAYYFVYPLCNTLMENETIRPLYPVSVLVTCAVICTVTYQVFFLLKREPVTQTLTSLRWSYTLVYIGLTFGAHYIFSKFSMPEDFTICDDKPHSLYNFFILILRLANSRPAGFFASHFAYFGLTLSFLVLNYKHIVHQTLSNGYGAVLLLFVITILFINTESHQFVIVYPFIIYYIVTNPLYVKLKGWHVSALGLLAVFLSKVWYPINPLDATKYATGNMEDFYALYKFPMQKYFMNLGPWMGNKMYVIHLIAFVVTTWLIYSLHVRLSKNTPVQT